MKKRFSVALFVGHMESKFSEEIFLGAAHAAERLDLNLVVFPVRFLEEEHTNDALSKKYHYQYNCMFSYAEKQSFDAVIIETAVMGRYVTQKTLYEIISRFEGTPVITISEKIGDYPCVSFETNGIDTEIDHLVTIHGRKHIGFVSGPSSNLEAMQRLERYKVSLKRHGIEYNPKLVVEGDFTENCGDVIDKLLDDNAGTIDAVCFANDLMAIAGYREINNHNLTIGRDIMVMGFDDIPEAMTLNPPLTTIRARYRDLGTNAVKAVNEILNGAPASDVTVKTHLIERDSCGCKSPITTDREYLEELTLNDPDITAFMNKINEIIYSYYNNTNYRPNKRLINILLKFSSLFLTEIKENSDQLNFALFTFKFDVLLNYRILDFIPEHNLNFILSVLCDKAVSIAPDEKRREEIYRIFMEFYKQIIMFESKQSHSYADSIKKNVRYANSIIGNTIDTSGNENRVPVNIMQSLRAINIRSSYLYIHEKPVISKSRYDWVQPPYEMLYSYHIGDRFHSYVKGRKVMAEYLFRNEYMPENRFTFIASPVFCSEENYGLLLYDIDTDDYNFYNSIIASQLSYAIKLRNMLDKQRAEETTLRESLTQATTHNQKLSRISKSDELTGIANRRGFTEDAEKIIRENYGKCAAVVFADMDNLKQINDYFGHEEGDFAIRKSAEILSVCMRSEDVVARFGGDEFAAFALTDDEADFSNMVRERINSACDEVNRTSGKPYMIRISTGVHEFTCSPESDINKILNEADKLLYQNKKQKIKSVLRTSE